MIDSHESLRENRNMPNWFDIHKMGVEQGVSALNSLGLGILDTGSRTGSELIGPHPCHACCSNLLHLLHHVLDKPKHSIAGLLLPVKKTRKSTKVALHHLYLMTGKGLFKPLYLTPASAFPNRRCSLEW